MPPRYRGTSMVQQALANELMNLRRLPEPVFRVCFAFVNWTLVGKQCALFRGKVVWIFKIQHSIRTQTAERRIITDIIYDPQIRRVIG